MKLSYLDTSAAMKLLVAEPESAALAKSLSSDRRLASAWLLHTELQHAPLRSHDAIQLAVAIRLGVDEIVTYDNELAESATAAGLVVFAPA